MCVCVCVCVCACACVCMFACMFVCGCEEEGGHHACQHFLAALMITVEHIEIKCKMGSFLNHLVT